VLSLEGFDKIEVQADKGLVVVGCGAKWGKILEATLAHRLVPYIMVTSSAASAGGTLSSNSISRFSPSVGREGAHVAAFKLLTLDSNELIDCCDKPNSENFSTFLSVIGGLGYVGAVLEITYRLMPLAHENSMVKTKFTLVEGLRGVSGKLARTTDQRYRPLVKPFVDSVCGHCNVAKPQLPTPAAGAAAFSVAVNLRGSGWGLFAHSTYEKLATPLEKSIFHDPTSWRHILLQLAAMIPVLRKLGYWLAYRQYRGGEKAFTDPLHGYTFFEDGNRLVRRFLHALGLPAWLVQQTFMIPCDVSKPEESAAQLLHFLGEADGLFAEQKVDPALVDILYVGKDPHQFTLSSSRNMDAFAITFSFERMFTQPILEAAALRKLSEACLRLGGRVHLVKHVHADESTLCKMYGPAFKALHETRKERQSDQVLANEFSARVLTGI
jgi:decaprenylphospho-beta-D-ribofuranose 2-oxidase